MAINYNPGAFTNGLILCLDAGNVKSYPGSGSVWTDLSGNGLTGTLTNGPTYSSSNGGSIVFDGVNDHVVINNSTIFNNNVGTVDFWIYVNSFNNADWFSYGIGSGSVAQLYIRYNAASLDFSFGGIGKEQSYSFTGSGLTNNFPTTTWRNVCAVYDNNAGAGTIYVNGNYVVDMTNAANARTVWTSANMFIGGFTWDGYSNSRISSFKMYNRALTAEQVLQNYNALRGRYGL